MPLTPPKSSVASRPSKPPITSEAVKRQIDKLVDLGLSRKLIVNIGPGNIQDAYVEHRERIEP